MKTKWIGYGTLALTVLVLAACDNANATQAPDLQPTTAQGIGVPTSAETSSPVEGTVSATTPAFTTEPTQADSVPRVAPMTSDLLAPANITVGLQQVAGGLVHPVNMANAGDGSGRLFIVDQTGQIYVVDSSGTMLSEPFLDVSGRMVSLNEGYDERGLLGLAFHPAYENNGRFFVYYTAPLRGGSRGDHTNTLSEFRVSADNPNRADANSERVMIQIDQPQGNHSGGQIRFGPDGYLYIPLGDGGGSNDAYEGHAADWYDYNDGGNGQDTESNLLGSILRIDVDNGEPYSIPADNPLGDEHWAWGFRNPYSMHFDVGGENWLIVADAGQNQWEEADVVQRGGNYGWNVLEGTHCFSTDNPDSAPSGCPYNDLDGNPLMSPVVEYRNLNSQGGVGLVIVGGTIYRGSAIPDLSGMYVFSSWSSSWSETRGQLFVAQPGPPTELWSMWALPTTTDGMGRLNEAILGFGVDEANELYVLTSQSIGPQGNIGAVWRIVPATQASNVIEREPLAIAFTELRSLLRYFTDNR